MINSPKAGTPPIDDNLAGLHVHPPAMPRNEGARIFGHPALEALTRTHITVPLVLFYGSGLAGILHSALHLPIGAWALAGMVLLGVLAFTLAEYLIHRFLYHIPADGPGRARFQFIIHGVHHEHPRDRQRLAMPPILSVLIAVVLMGLFRWLLGPEGLSFGAGFLMGYATYLLIHYSIHMYRPPRNFLRALWKHHHLHHYAGDDRAFGVSSPLWDWVFGTLPREPRDRKG
jgi:sterol desaturase/sphingolipid hydroxylase (fatty acid hydroxylase superfamily)